MDDRALETSARRLPQSPGFCLYDISDYLDACIGQRGITGIQRVQESLVREILKHQTLSSFVFVDRRYGRVWTVSRAGTTELVAEASPDSPLYDRGARSRFAEELCNSAKLHIVLHTDIFINLGPFWGPQYGSRFNRRLKDANCPFIPMIYDLIPIDHPTLCDERTVEFFAETLPDTMRHAKRIITISDYTSSRVKAFADSQGIVLPPIDVVRLAHHLKSQHDPADGAGPPKAFPEFEGGFVLCVGTLEPRKNQIRLAEAWARLADDITQIPMLVFVGKLGWLPEDALARLRDIGRVTGRIVLLHDVSDSQLDWLYRNCLFTTFLPIDEGWGLPVGESLACGKVCLASNTGAVPEVGGEYVVYVDPLSTMEIDRKLRSLIVRADRRKDLEQLIADGFRSRTWTEVAKTLEISIQLERDC